MTALRRRMIEDMGLAGLSAGTQERYVRAVAQLARAYQLSWVGQDRAVRGGAGRRMKYKCSGQMEAGRGSVGG